MIINHGNRELACDSEFGLILGVMEKTTKKHHLLQLETNTIIHLVTVFNTTIVAVIL